MLLKRWLPVVGPEVFMALVPLFILLGLHFLGPEKDKNISIMVAGMFDLFVFFLLLLCRAPLAYWAAAIVSTIAAFTALIFSSTLAAFSYNWIVFSILFVATTFIIIESVSLPVYADYSLPKVKVRLSYLAEAVVVFFPALWYLRS